MSITVKNTQLQGTIQAPASKSHTIRLLAAALLSQNQTVITNPSRCNDALAAKNAIIDLGANVETELNKWTIKGGLNPQKSTIAAGESGLLARMLIPVVALTGKTIEINGQESLIKRKLGNIESTFENSNVNVKTNNGYLPVSINGKLTTGTYIVDASKTSQFLTGMLLALPLAQPQSQDYSRLIVTDLKSRTYIEMTVDLLKKQKINFTYSPDFSEFEIKGGQNYQGGIYRAEGDWSGAAFILVAAALNGKICIENLNYSKVQPDSVIVEILQQAKVKIHWEQNKVCAEKSNIKAFSTDITHCPDLAPPLVALASAAEGTSEIYGIDRLFNKESNRAVALKTEAAKIGLKIDLDYNLNRMLIHGAKTLKGGSINSWNDHRIAMFGAVTALNTQNGVTIENQQAVNKSFPDFFKVLKKLGGQIL